MTIPTQMSLTGFIATTPQLTFTQSGIARFYARVGVDHYRREADGAWTKLDPTFHDLVMFRNKAEKAYERFRPGDHIVASGYVHEFTRERNGLEETHEQFVAKQMGHDAAKTKYEVQRRAPELDSRPDGPTPPSPTLHSV
ncbi:single-stranded DNA-binding protein [Nocardioides sp. NPDC057772]|uniref:single-stranded DNA-binding protein n=1 Tax=unclassified Nocardioides TaxID=2615069 RepID=UPI0002028C96|nr:single-stranded DNA-binding protein [Nocardioides sp. NBC_00368]EGD42830.1 single-strand binding protein [Nocardioidaceae bacterium Broad-1]